MKRQEFQSGDDDSITALQCLDQMNDDILDEICMQLCNASNYSLGRHGLFAGVAYLLSRVNRRFLHWFRADMQRLLRNNIWRDHMISASLCDNSVKLANWYYCHGAAFDPKHIKTYFDNKCMAESSPRCRKIVEKIANYEHPWKLGCRIANNPHDEEIRFLNEQCAVEFNRPELLINNFIGHRLLSRITTARYPANINILTWLRDHNKLGFCELQTLAEISVRYHRQHISRWLVLHYFDTDCELLRMANISLEKSTKI